MRTFTISLLATAAAARGNSGGVNQGYGNQSFGSTHGFGYNIGNDYTHGDNHGQYMAHQKGYGKTNQGFGLGADVANQYSAPDAHAHLTGYDTVQPVSDSDWVVADATALATAINTEIDAQQALRATQVEEALTRRLDRLNDIHADNLVKIEAPFDLQLDLLAIEKEDVTKAKTYAAADATAAYNDLILRMDAYKADRDIALDREMDRAIRAIERAQTDSKPVDEVLYAMRLDWLQGVYVSGSSVFFDSEIYDKSVFDSEFDLFTYDIGHGKGHGHTTGKQAPLNDHEQGFVYGNGGTNTGDISMLNGSPGPVDGRAGRYDRATQSGHGAPGRPSDYQLGLEAGQKEGVFGYNQAADLQVQSSRKRSAPKRRSPPRPRSARRPSSSRRPRRTSRTSRKPTAQKVRRPSRNPTQRVRSISKKTTYNDYAPMAKGGYY